MIDQRARVPGFVGLGTTPLDWYVAETHQSDGSGFFARTRPDASVVAAYRTLSARRYLLESTGCACYPCADDPAGAFVAIDGPVLISEVRIMGVPRQRPHPFAPLARDLRDDEPGS